MGGKSVGIEKHSTEYRKECWQIKPNVARDYRGKLGFIMRSPRGS